jgi:alkaline phosphatase
VLRLYFQISNKFQNNKQMKIFTTYFFLSVILLLTGCKNTVEKTTETGHVRNVIFMIGDGMGVNHMYAAYTANNGTLAIERSEFMGLIKTYAADNYVTESAAAATAIAGGQKTNNGMVGVCPDGNPLKSMLTYAAEHGLSTGMVVTCELTHATPAAFVAHVPSRSDHEGIAFAFTQSKINVAIGGGRKFFENRSDGKNLTEMMKSNGFQVAYTMSDVKKVQEGNLLALLADVALEGYPARGNMLPEAVETAINILNQNEKGFFLMVEGSQIDWAAHGNDIESVVNETLDFDRAVKIAFDFAERCGNTLVIVAGDHETGGLSIIDGCFESGEIITVFTTTRHTGVPVPVYSFGPGAKKFSGFFDNTDFLPRVLKLLGIIR